MSWTDDEAEKLKALARSGLSANQIAGRLGKTRNAVISKCHRQGYELKGKTGRKGKPGNRKPPTRTWRPRMSSSLFPDKVEPMVCNEPDLVIPLGERKTLVDLDEHDCRWPYGDPKATDFHFCGRNKTAGLPYCEFHVRRAYQSPQPLRRRVQESEEIPANSSSVQASKEAVEA